MFLSSKPKYDIFLIFCYKICQFKPEWMIIPMDFTWVRADFFRKIATISQSFLSGCNLKTKHRSIIDALIILLFSRSA